MINFNCFITNSTLGCYSTNVVFEIDKMVISSNLESLFEDYTNELLSENKVILKSARSEKRYNGDTRKMVDVDVWESKLDYQKDSGYVRLYKRFISEEENKNIHLICYPKILGEYRDYLVQKTLEKKKEFYTDDTRIKYYEDNIQRKYYEIDFIGENLFLNDKFITWLNKRYGESLKLEDIIGHKNQFLHEVDYGWYHMENYVEQVIGRAFHKAFLTDNIIKVKDTPNVPICVVTLGKKTIRCNYSNACDAVEKLIREENIDIQNLKNDDKILCNIDNLDLGEDILDYIEQDKIVVLFFDEPDEYRYTSVIIRDENNKIIEFYDEGEFVEYIKTKL